MRPAARSRATPPPVPEKQPVRAPQRSGARPAPKTPVFLERATYRQRRLGDAARLLPLVGALFWLIPLLWAVEGDQAVSNQTALVYIFGVWVVLIAASAILSRRLRETSPDPRPHLR